MLNERYRIVGLLGKGGMGEVYRADDLKLRQPVALKFLPAALSKDVRKLERFHHEVRVARQVSHPNVCRVYDIGEADGQHFISMEYIDGEDLASVLRRMGRPSTDKAVEIARQLCAGLAAAHDKGVLHRDLKPHNVMIDGNGKVRVTDFGLAGFVEDFAGRNVAAGTPAYMAPEQLAGREVSVKSDIYSLGLVLFELFSGKRRYEGVTREQIERVRSTTPTTLSGLAQDIDPAVERVIQRCLELEPAARPSSALAVAAALPGGDPLAAALAAGETPSPELVASARDRGALTPRWALAMLTTVIVLLGIFAGVQQRTSRDPVLSQDALSARAEEILREFGHQLPTFTTGSLATNDEFRAFVNKPDPPDWDVVDRECPLIYRYWRRWSPSALQPESLHSPIPGIADPQARPPGSITIVLDSAGNLIELEVIPAAELPTANSGPEPEPDWSEALRYAELEQAERQPVDPSRAVPAYCDRVVAWHVDRSLEDGGPCVFQVGTYRGRIVHVTTVWDWDLGGPISRAMAQVQGTRKGVSDSDLASLFFLALNVLAWLLAWHNLRLGRCDRRGAILMGLAVGCSYLLFEAISAPLHEFTIGSYLANLSSDRGFGHALIHAVWSLLAYLAVEPYVRRIWPRSLIGWARLSQGRVRDPAVGRELLVGVVVAFVFVGLMLAIGQAEDWFGFRELDAVRASPEVIGNSGRLGMNLAHFLAVAALVTMWYYFLLAVIRLVTRKDSVAMIIFVAINVGIWVVPDLRAMGAERLLLLSDVVGPLLLLSLSAFLLVRVGLIAGMMLSFVGGGPFGGALGSVPLTLDLSAPYAPQALLGMAVIVFPALYGFWTSLGGQPLFKDPLLTEKPARA